MQKLAVALNSTEISQQSTMVFSTLNEIADTTTIDVCLFKCNPGQLVGVPKFAIMNVEHAWSYNGIVIAGNIYSASKILACPQPRKKYLYVFDLEWCGKQEIKYRAFADVYQNPELNILVRSKHHKQIMKDCWNVEAEVLPDFNTKDLIKLVEKDYESITS